jgi:hypothetical protein
VSGKEATNDLNPSPLYPENTTMSHASTVKCLLDRVQLHSDLARCDIMNQDHETLIAYEVIITVATKCMTAEQRQQFLRECNDSLDEMYKVAARDSS